MTTGKPLQSESFEAPESAKALNNLFFARGWTDGLPVMPPTEEAVQEMLAYTDREPGEIVGTLPPRHGEATVEKIAINAVMAGCLPEHLPILIAAVEAMAEPKYFLSQVLTSTHGCSPLVLINGPLVTELQINYGYHTLGEGIRSNATIGRAIRLIVKNIAGVPGRTDVDTFGAITRYHHIFAENEGENPWEPFHVERDFARDTSTVTVFGAEPPHHLDDMGSTNAQNLLWAMANTLPGAGTRHFQEFGEPVICFGPQHARTLAEGGFSKKDVKRFIYEHARLPIRKHSPETFRKINVVAAPKWYSNLSDEAYVPIAEKAEDIIILVSGGAGTHSLFIPQQVNIRSVTKAITCKDGRPVKSIKELRQ